MTDPGDGETLLGGGGGEQGSGTAEKDMGKLSTVQLVQKLAAKDNGAASTAGTAGMDILFLPVEYQGPTVHQLSAQGNAVPLRQFQQHFFSGLTQVPGYDQIEILRYPVQIFQMLFYSCISSRG